MGRRYLPVGGLQREYDEATGSFLRVVDSQKETFSATPDLEQGLVVMASSFGAIGDGTTNDAASIQAAIDYVADFGGGTVVLTPGVYTVASGLAINTPFVRLVGAGCGWFSGTHTERATTIKYTGAGGTVLTLTSVSGASNQKVADCAILGIAIDGNSLASIGLLVASVNQCEFDVSIAGCTSVQCEWKTVATLADTTNNQHNRVKHLRVRATGSANGIKFDTDVLPGNTSMNVFGYLYAQHVDGYGVRLGNTDNNVFEHIVCNGTGTGVGIVLGAGDNTTRLNCRANNILICSPGDGGVTAEGTPTDPLPSASNRIWFYDKDNATPDPIIEADASLSWATTDSVMSGWGFVGAGFGNSEANVINAIAQAISAAFPQVIVSGNGHHIQLDNGATGKWNLNVDAATDCLLLEKADTGGHVGITLSAVENFANDGAAAAGGVEVGSIYRNGSVLMIRAV